MIAQRRRLPSAIVGPCCECGDESSRTLGRYPYCAACADELVDELRASVLARDGGHGVAVAVGRRRPEYGGRFFDCGCSICDATWSAIPGDPCPYCAAVLERQRNEQRRALLAPQWLTDWTPPTSPVVQGWVQRVARAVRAGVVDEPEARRAVERAARHIELLKAGDAR